MSSFQTAMVSLAGLLIGAGLAVAGSKFKDPTLTNLGSTIIGGAIGVFVPQAARHPPPIPTNGNGSVLRKNTEPGVVSAK